jgi:hypothetical protein
MSNRGQIWKENLLKINKHILEFHNMLKNCSDCFKTGVKRYIIFPIIKKRQKKRTNGSFVLFMKKQQMATLIQMNSIIMVASKWCCHIYKYDDGIDKD